MKFDDIALPPKSIALVFSDLGDGTFSTVIVGDPSDVPEPMLEMAVGCKKLIHMDQKTIRDAVYEDIDLEALGVADNIDWANQTSGEAN